jgi:hypothetical protein
MMNGRKLSFVGPVLLGTVVCALAYNPVSTARGDDDPQANDAARPDKGLFLRRLGLPQSKEKDTRAEVQDLFVQALYLDPTGTRLLAVGLHESYCIDVAGAKLLQRIRNDSSLRRSFLLVGSPDARFVVVPDADGKEFTLRDAATGRAIGGAQRLPEEKVSLSQWTSRFPTFTPARQYLLVAASSPRDSTLYAISTQTGKRQVVDLSNRDRSNRDFSCVLALPQQSTLFLAGGARVDRKSNPSGVAVLDLATGKETRLASLTVGPSTIENRCMALSPDGTLLLVKSKDTLEVCDWRNDQLVFQYQDKLGHLVHPWFTPDGKRLIALRRASGVLRLQLDPENPGRTLARRIDDVICLFDLTRQEPIGSFTPAQHGLDTLVRALAMSHDGRSFAVWSGNEVTLIDFQTAFGIAPLPPQPRLEGPEELPLKPEPAKAEMPRRRKP